MFEVVNHPRFFVKIPLRQMPQCGVSLAGTSSAQNYKALLVVRKSEVIIRVHSFPPPPGGSFQSCDGASCERSVFTGSGAGWFRFFSGVGTKTGPFFSLGFSLSRAYVAKPRVP